MATGGSPGYNLLACHLGTDQAKATTAVSTGVLAGKRGI